MAFGAPVSLGTTQNKTAEAATTLVTTAVAPAGSVIVVAVAYDANGTYLSTGSIPGTTYLDQDVIGDGTGANLPAIICWYHYVNTDVAAGTSITINWSTQPTAKAMTALYAPGAAASPLDVRGTATGSSSTPSVSTSGSTVQADGITIGFVATEGPSGDTFTQDSSPAYSTPPVRVGTTGGSAATNMTIAGGYFIETATGTKTYNPTLGTSRDWAAAIVTLKASTANSYSYTGAGGGQSGGVAPPVLSVAPPASGGAIASGLAALVLSIALIAGGGATSGGAAATQFAPAYQAAGGAQSGGAAAHQSGVLYTAAGGATCGGAATGGAQPTRLYFHDAVCTVSGTLPSGEQSARPKEWETTGGSTNRTMSPAIGTGQASLSGTSLAQTTGQRGLLGMFISPPLSGAQTVGGGDMILNAAEAEAHLDANFWINSLTAYVWRPSTGALVGYIRDTGASGGTEPTSASSEQVSHLMGLTTSPVSAADGDVIVGEVWAVHTQATATAYTCTFYYDGTTVNTTENAVVSNHASFLQLAEQLVFQGGSSSYEYAAAGGAQSGGVAAVAVDAVVQASGGAQSGGAAAHQSGVLYTAAGGATCGGAAAFAPGWVIQASGGAQSGGEALTASTRYADLVRATETDSARSVSALRLVDLARTTETDSARSVSALRLVDLARTTETDSARSVSALRLVDLARATETDSARSVSALRLVDLARTTETDSARSGSALRLVDLARATETDSARSGSALRLVDLARATETDSARSVSASQALFADLVRATETDSARSVSALRLVDLARATETDSARSVSALRLVDLARATETDSARSVSASQALFADLIRAIEASSARGLTVSRSYGRRSVRVVLVEEETGVSQTLELSVTTVLFERGYEAIAYAHGPEDIEFEVEVEDIAA